MSTEIKTQVVVLGAGPAGYSAAFRCADLGLETVLVERYSTLGGVCLNVGCIPSKALLHVAKVIEEAKALAEHGIVFGEPKTDIDKVRVWKEKVITQLTGGLAGMAKGRKVKVVNGLASSPALTPWLWKAKTAQPPSTSITPSSLQVLVRSNCHSFLMKIHACGILPMRWN